MKIESITFLSGGDIEVKSVDDRGIESMEYIDCPEFAKETDHAWRDPLWHLAVHLLGLHNRLKVLEGKQ